MKVFVSAGEVSGDRIAARVIDRWNSLDSGVCFAGCAGERMRATGCIALANAEDFSHVGWSSVLRNLPELVWKHLLLQNRLAKWNPDRLVVVDSPGLHLPLLRKWRQRGVPCVWIAPPQLWAWKGRTLPALENLAVVPLHAFELPALEAQKAKPHWFGYLGERPSHWAPSDAKLLALLPGTRPAWRRRHLQLFVEAGRIASEKLDLESVLLDPRPQNRRVLGLRVLSPEEALPRAQLALGMPGTGLLEAAIHGVPAVAAAQPGWLDRILAGTRLDEGSLILTNRILKQRLVPEWYAPNLSANTLAQSMLAVFGNRDKIREQLSVLNSALGPANACELLAENFSQGSLFQA